MQGRDEARDQRLSSIETDVREARDGVREIAAVQVEQNFPKQLMELRAELEKRDTERRSDLINASDKIRTELREITKRVDVLEKEDTRQAATWTVFRVIKDYWALISSIAILGAGVIFGKIKIG
jgi:light-regulated signal transduction histidine kinase (bacteriophytochrome)